MNKFQKEVHSYQGSDRTNTCDYFALSCSVGGKDELVTRLNLGLLGGLPHQLVLGVQGAGEGSGARFLLLQVKLLVLSSFRVHLHDNPLGLGADVLGAEGDCARVGECRRQRTASGY